MDRCRLLVDVGQQRTIPLRTDPNGIGQHRCLTVGTPRSAPTARESDPGKRSQGRRQTRPVLLGKQSAFQIVEIDDNSRTLRERVAQTFQNGKQRHTFDNHAVWPRAGDAGNQRLGISFTDGQDGFCGYGRLQYGILWQRELVKRADLP